MAAVWTEKARRYVEGRQERHYRALAEAMGLGSDPKAAYQRLSGAEMPMEYAAPDKLRRFYGAEPFLRPEEWDEFDRRFEAQWKEFASVQAPTAYEDPNLYRSITMTFGQIQGPLKRQGRGLDPEPLLATMASGELNARLSREPGGAPIIYFERGLFGFFDQFAKLVAWCTPAIPPDVLTDEAALANRAGRHVLHPAAPQLFVDLFTSYAITGKAARIPEPPGENIFTNMLLLQMMERFVTAHEICHLRLGHLDHSYRDQDGAWDQEHHADVAGLGLMSEVHSEETAWRAIDFWAADLALTGMHYLDATLDILEHAKLTAWISPTHPAAIVRRKYLRNAVLTAKPRISEATLAATQRLWSMTDSIFGRLWEMIFVDLVVMRGRPDSRPSAMWRQRIDTSFATD